VIIGREERRFEVAASTNDLAFDLASAGCPEGTIVIAGRQTGGRGRQGRTWFSMPGASLTFSVVLRPRRKQQEWPELPWVVAGSVAETLTASGVGEVALKSPNDVMAGAGKIAGILLENRLPRTGPAVVAGIGVNINIRHEEFPADLRESATSLLEVLGGKKRDPEEVLEGVCRSLDELYDIWQREGAALVRVRLEEKGIAFRDFPDNSVRE